MKKIVIVTPYFWPEISPNAHLMKDLTSFLAQSGFQIIIFTSRPSKKSVLINNIKRNQNIEEINSNKIKIFRLKNPFSRKPGYIFKLLDYIFFSFWVILKLIFIHKIDICHVCSNPPLLGLPINLVGKFKGFKTIYDLQDLFPNSARASGLISDSNFIFYILRYLEKLTYVSSTIVVTICKSYQEHVYNIAECANIKIIPNWVDINVIRPIAKDENLFLKENINLKNKFIALYAGTIGYLQDIGVLIKAAALLNETEDIAFVIVGYGPRRPYLLNEIKMLNLKNIFYYDFQPEQLISHVYNAASVGIIPMKSASDPMPSKTWNYLACEKPIIILADEKSEVGRLINEIGAGKLIPSGDYMSLSNEIMRLYKNQGLLKPMGISGRKYVMENHSKIKCLNQWKEIIENL
jgi:colanic acid biosynthesis glycosyl transferase WcaI